MTNSAISAPAATLILSCLLTGLSGCSGVKIPPLQNLQNDVPATWSNALTEATPGENNAPSPDLESWWTAFADPKLNRIVEQALANNLDLAQARYRIDQTRILLGHASDPFLPEVHARAQPVESASGREAYFQYGLDATWELGLFGRQASRQQVAEADMLGSEARAQAIKVSVIAEIVRTYIVLRTHQQQLVAIASQQQLAQQRIDLLALRVKLGFSSDKDVVTATNELNHINAAVYGHKQAIDEAAQGLALLLGEIKPDPLWLTPDTQPLLPGISFNKLPADLLRARPEIRMAEASVLKATGEVGIARAEIYPYISLGTLYVFSTDITQNYSFDVITHSTPALGPTIDIPLFDWGRRRANLKAQSTALDESLLAYRAAILKAMTEGEIALSSFGWQAKLRQQSEVNVAAQATLAKRSQALNSLGLASPLDGIELQLDEQVAQIELLDARASEDLAFIALYKAFGGAPLPEALQRKDG